MNKQIKIGDHVFTFIKEDRYPVDRRIVEKIIQTDKGTTIVLEPTLDPEYHSKDETIEVDMDNVFVDLDEFKNHLEKCKKEDIEKYISQMNKIYEEFLHHYKLS